MKIIQMALRLRRGMSSPVDGTNSKEIVMSPTALPARRRAIPRLAPVAQSNRLKRCWLVDQKQHELVH